LAHTQIDHVPGLYIAHMEIKEMTNVNSDSIMTMATAEPTGYLSTVVVVLVIARSMST